MWYMDILCTLLGTLVSFFCISAYLVFLHCFYDTGYKWHKKKAFFLFLCALIEYAADTYLSRFTNLDTLLFIISVVVFLLKCCLVIYDYEGKKLLGLLRFLLVSVLAEELMSTLAATTTFLLLPDIELELQSLTPLYASIHASVLLIFVYLVSIIFFGFVFFYLYFTLYKRGIVIKCGTRQLVFVILYPILCTAACLTVAYFGKDSNITLIILAGSSLFLALFFPIFVYSARINQHYQEQTIYQENYMQAELDHFNRYKQSQEETARFRHDIRNNLLCIREMLQSGKKEEATQYLQDLLHTSETLRQKYVTGDEMLDCIIGAKAESMAEHGISFQLNGVIAGGLHWKPMDVCIVFANALDNAIDACQKLPPEKRQILFTIRSTPQYWFISIENPVSAQVNTDRLFQKNGGYTTKADAAHHGIGTHNIKRAVEKNGGILDARCENDLFVLEIMINKNNT